MNMRFVSGLYSYFGVTTIVVLFYLTTLRLPSFGEGVLPRGFVRPVRGVSCRLARRVILILGRGVRYPYNRAHLLTSSSRKYPHGPFLRGFFFNALSRICLHLTIVCLLSYRNALPMGGGMAWHYCIEWRHCIASFPYLYR